jgi:hypothetical protein
LMISRDFGPGNSVLISGRLRVSSSVVGVIVFLLFRLRWMLRLC